MKKLGVLFAAVAASIILFSYGSMARGENTAIPFSLSLIYPQNQIEADAGYFYIDLDSNETQELSIEVRNITSNDISIDIETADCYTSPRGGLIYISNNKSKDIGYTDDNYMMAKNIVPLEARITLKPNESRTVRFNVTAPEIEEGELIGAIRFSDASLKLETDENGGGESNLQINIKSAMTIPVRVRLPKEPGVVSPAIVLGDVGINTDEGKIIFSLSNNLPIINRLAKISYNVADRSGNVLFESDFDLDKMAPKTSVNIPLEWKDTKVTAGKYTINVNYQISGTQTKTESREITLDKKDAGEIIPETQLPEPVETNQGFSILYYGIFIFLIAVIIVLIVMLFKKRKNP